MGCLKSIIRKIMFIALVVAFFAFGGYAFVKEIASLVLRFILYFGFELLLPPAYSEADGRSIESLP